MERKNTINSFRWDRVKTILLDMDGTLLDLKYDNYFWLELVPQKYAEKHQLSKQEADKFLKQLYQKYHGTLEWYCIDFWSEKLSLDISKLKRNSAEQVAYRKGTLEFLSKAKASGKKLYLVTNAHPETLAIKLEQKDFSDYFEEMISSHETGYPKENINFWNAIKQRWQFDLDSTLFVDDSVSILEVARQFGIYTNIGITNPDSTKSPVAFRDFLSVNQLNELFEL